MGIHELAFDSGGTVLDWPGGRVAMLEREDGSDALVRRLLS